MSASHFRCLAAGHAALLQLSAEAMFRRSIALASLCTLAACASAQSQYPSLAIRPGERETGTLQPVASEPVFTPVPKSTLDRVSQLAADGRANHQAFVEQVASARPIIEAGRGAKPGDDAWAKAEAALADVRAARSRAGRPGEPGARSDPNAACVRTSAA